MSGLRDRSADGLTLWLGLTSGRPPGGESEGKEGDGVPGSGDSGCQVMEARATEARPWMRCEVRAVWEKRWDRCTQGAPTAVCRGHEAPGPDGL